MLSIVANQPTMGGVSRKLDEAVFRRVHLRFERCEVPMPLGTLLLLALGVSADAFAVALGKGLQLKAHVARSAAIMATAFGLAQAVMPLIGWTLGSTFAEAIAPFDHWIAFGVLGVIGAKMVWEAARGDEHAPSPSHPTVRMIAILAVATSVDALAVGLTLALLDVSIWVAITLIGVVTFGVSFAGAMIGNRIGAKYRKPAEIFGGLVLIGIGTQVLIEHLLH